MLDVKTDPPQVALRPASDIMRLRRMGAMFPTRLSFLRTLMRWLAEDEATVTRPVWSMTPEGYGHAVYSVTLQGYTYSLVAVSNDPPPDMRTDRVIAEAWDSAYVLYDGVPDSDEIARIVANAPLQEAGRFSERDLVLSRANKSVRLFAHVADALRAGTPLDEDLIRSTGYLMRTTAVYGNGKFGIADRERIQNRPGLSGPFAAEMLTVWLIRGFTHDLVENVGQAPLPRHIKHCLGIGNSTGLGMAPFLVSHPLLLDSWMQVRETALARVRATQSVDDELQARLIQLGERAARHLGEWQVPDEIAQTRIDTLRLEWPEVQTALSGLEGKRPLDALMHSADRWSVDTQELLVALLLEPFGALIDGLTDCMANPFVPVLDPRMSCEEMAELIRTHAAWALKPSYEAPGACAQFWYVSEEKLEPRLGNRHEEEGAELESPLDIARRTKEMLADLEGQTGPLGSFLAAFPQHRFVARRLQSLPEHPYAEIQDNLIADTCLPIDMLRCKLSFFGASKFDPKSDRWTRITLAQGAPLFDELAEADDWWLPCFAS